MSKKRRRTPLRRRPLTIQQILAWADAHREATGRWPRSTDGMVCGALFENWKAINSALGQGLRDLPGGSSIARLLAEHRGVRNIHGLGPLSEEQILAWADAHYERTGSWPTVAAGKIPDARGEKWKYVDYALRNGRRDLPGGSTLTQLLAARRGARNIQDLPPLTEEQILAWADAHYQRTGSWPTRHSGPIADAPGETWMAAHMALRKGNRKLAPGSSLALLLAEHRGVRNVWSRPDLSVEQILAWADAFHERSGSWPSTYSGAVAGAPGETWRAIDHVLRRGGRAMPGGSSLGRLLAARRQVRRNVVNTPPLERQQIVTWAKNHFRRSGRWPTKDSGPIPEAPDETWAAVDAALRGGLRSLGRPSSLAQLLQEKVGRRNIHGLPPLSRKKILAWADAHYARTGRWPKVTSGPVRDAPGEDWRAIDAALRSGGRKIAGRTSLARLLAAKRGVPNRAARPPLTEEQIVDWARLHYARTGAWPTSKSGPIHDVPQETWSAVDTALRHGGRNLPGGSSLQQLREHLQQVSAEAAEPAEALA